MQPYTLLFCIVASNLSLPVIQPWPRPVFPRFHSQMKCLLLPAQQSPCSPLPDYNPLNSRLSLDYNHNSHIGSAADKGIIFPVQLGYTKVPRHHLMIYLGHKNVLVANSHFMISAFLFRCSMLRVHFLLIRSATREMLQIWQEAIEFRLPVLHPFAISSCPTIPLLLICQLPN